MRATDRTFGWAVLALLAGPWAAFSQGDVPGPGDRTIEVAFDVLATGVGAPTRTAGGLRSGSLAAGAGTGRAYLSASPGAGGAACPPVMVAVDLAPPASVSASVAVWAVEARVAHVAAGEAAVDVRWRRLGPPAFSASASDGSWDRIVLENGQRVLLDFVAVPASGSSCVRNFALELSARRPQPAGLENRMIGYEIWMVHEKQGRLVRSRSFRSSVPTGTVAAFRFPPERLDSTVDVTLQGDVHGGVRPDGRIDVVVSARRTVTLEDGSGAFAEAGRKTATVSSGDPVRLVLPDVSQDAPHAAALTEHSFSLVLVARSEP